MLAQSTLSADPRRMGKNHENHEVATLSKPFPNILCNWKYRFTVEANSTFGKIHIEKLFEDFFFYAPLSPLLPLQVSCNELCTFSIYYFQCTTVKEILAAFSLIVMSKISGSNKRIKESVCKDLCCFRIPQCQGMSVE